MGGLSTGAERDGRGPNPNNIGNDVTETTRLLDGATSNATSVGPRYTWAGAEDFDGHPWWRKPSVYWLVGPFFLYTLAFGGIIVPKLNLIISLICREYFADQTSKNPGLVFPPVILGGNNEECQISPVQKTATKMTLVMNLAVGLLSAISAPKLGHLSDRYGRAKWLALSSCGGIIGEIITIVAAKFPDVVDYRWIILGSVFDGLTGSFTAGTILGQSYASDCTPPSKRSVAIGYLHACLFTGLALGPILSAKFIKHTGNELVSIFYVALGCHVFFVLFVLFVLPESVSKRRQLLSREKYSKELEARGEDNSWLSSLRHRNPFAPLRILYNKHPSATSRFRRNIISLALVDMVLLGAAMGAGTVIILYSEYVFKWDNYRSSQFVSLVSTVRAFVLMAILPLINYIFRTRPAARRRRLFPGRVVETNKGCDELDIWLIRTALISDVLGATGYFFASTEPLFVLSGIVTAFGGLGSATIQAAITKHVPPEKVGQLLGAVGLLHGLARVAAPLAFNGLYHATLDTYPQAIFILLAALFSVSLAASLIVKPHIYVRDDALPPSPAPRPTTSDSALEEELLI
ncbi:hypothetical protein SAPIO_CDS7508 [Scedosporium apiospermum]|uniref:Major facilitator superfamily (MFS) profile domain-containing protein n=1 Tax=Pseudallescheria apiosperma TaxID=563466 RepID=A0A084G223_PSEDA|nr:uncharacterized protein SAPIO_CDS7508 [Scedosporium apiospermum]KEZ41385.1 hypothetical protein SAPIO_CDS7508 [Scedosporium apiospermum]